MTFSWQPYRNAICQAAVRIMSIAQLTFRETVRSRLLLSLAVALAFVTIGMPMILKGDGTPAGLAQMTLYYTLGTAFGILAVASLWIACSRISGDIRIRTMQLVRVKPVCAWQIWLGKWLGLLLLNAILLCGSCVVIGVHISKQLAQHPEVGQLFT